MRVSSFLCALTGRPPPPRDFAVSEPPPPSCTGMGDFATSPLMERLQRRPGGGDGVGRGRTGHQFPTPSSVTPPPPPLPPPPNPPPRRRLLFHRNGTYVRSVALTGGPLPDIGAEYFTLMNDEVAAFARQVCGGQGGRAPGGRE